MLKVSFEDCSSEACLVSFWHTFEQYRLCSFCTTCRSDVDQSTLTRNDGGADKFIFSVQSLLGSLYLHSSL